MLRFNLLDNILNNGRINIHKSITPEFRKIYYGSAIVQYCISDGFLYVRERWLYMEIQVMEYSLYKSFLVYEETDGHIHVNLIFRLKFFPLGLKFWQPGVEEWRHFLALWNKSFHFILDFIDTVTDVSKVSTVWTIV